MTTGGGVREWEGVVVVLAFVVVVVVIHKIIIINTHYFKLYLK